ncbi:hypothetical protein SAMN05518845_106114 [Variovorax sp. YR750]|uniref:hypothetical protein n=1 Tax=Variovorax sp. YR750 TaxID=1884384 RepID=UPI0008D0A4AC|nr:hypothetical protein [Variovorax sp. YR750]SEL31207.1 hypothetical protein SAMN05518845_106114 [Variovorax sp. YR750]
MPKLVDYVRQNFPIDLQRAKVRHAIQFGDGLGLGLMSQELSEGECRGIVDKVVLKPAGGGHRHVRFVGFNQERVDELGACLDTALVMLRKARADVGLHTWPGKTNYETIFGSRAWHGSSATRKAGIAAGNAAAESGFMSRSKYVREKLGQMEADLRDPRWMLYDSNERGDAAALKGGRGGYLMAIGPSFPKGTAGHFHAGVLIHEVGHNLGLADVCGECQQHRLLLDAAHYTPRADADIPQCTGNNAHGPLAASGRGHFIGSKQVKRLAERHKNATIYNTDSYRWYCYAFFRNEVDAGIATHKALSAAVAAA